MTSPQDPNRPAQPGADAPGQPAPQGWGQPPAEPPPWGATPDPNQPGWTTTPPTGAGWGAPPAQNQPGWGAPPPGGPPAWGAPPQPGWGQPQGNQGWGGGPGWSPQPAKSNKKGCLIALAIVLVVALVGVGGCVYLVANTLAPAIGTELDIQSSSGGQITSGSYNWNNGVAIFTFTAAPGVTQTKPALKGTQFEKTHFVIYSPYGDLLADETTSCG